MCRNIAGISAAAEGSFGLQLHCIGAQGFLEGKVVFMQHFALVLLLFASCIDLTCYRQMKTSAPKGEIAKPSCKAHQDGRCVCGRCSKANYEDHAGHTAQD